MNIRVVLCLFIFLLGIVISFLVPLTAPVISIAFIIGGITLYKQATDRVMRAIAAAAIASGIVIIFLTILIWVLLYQHTIETTVIIENITYFEV